MARAQCHSAGFDILVRTDSLPREEEVRPFVLTEEWPSWVLEGDYEKSMIHWQAKTIFGNAARAEKVNTNPSSGDDS